MSYPRHRGSGDDAGGADDDECGGDADNVNDGDDSDAGGDIGNSPKCIRSLKL